eukprot:TRINITY_DN9363_c0_g6_i2.p1 TRINITY_DN9363_c0_g6~~TRINITY_DN9363_c0_g6_i2.p1  ORF type:complete len:284 (-),score=39.41 TRINITY_DN9363_c0_g6_i2:147-998(-)
MLCKLANSSRQKKNNLLFSSNVNSIARMRFSIKPYVKARDLSNTPIKKDGNSAAVKDTDLLKIRGLAGNNETSGNSNTYSLPAIKYSSTLVAKITSSLLSASRAKLSLSKGKRNASEKKGKSVKEPEPISLKCFKISAYRKVLADFNELKNDIKFAVKTHDSAKKSFISSNQTASKKPAKLTTKLLQEKRSSLEPGDSFPIVISAKRKPIISRLVSINEPEHKEVLSARVNEPKIIIDVKKKTVVPMSRMESSVRSKTKVMCDAWTATTNDLSSKELGLGFDY